MGGENMASLSDALTIGSMHLRNRIVLPPLTTNCGDRDGMVTDSVLRFYRQRSRHVGLVIVEAAAVRPDGRIVLGSLGIWEDKQMAGMTRLAESIRKNGAVPVLQLNQAGARCTPTGGEMQGASPSGVRFRPDVDPFSMSASQIDQVAVSFAEAAGRAFSSGFEGVEIHGAHFYLISQFLSPLTNKRDDRYGGDALGRATFALEVVHKVRQRAGQKPAILFRLNAVERVEGGQSLEDAITAGRALAEQGVDCIHASLVTAASWKEENGKRFLVAASALPKDADAGANVPPAAEIRKETGVPVIAVGKLGEGTAAADAVAGGRVDMVAVGRQMIADPDAAGKLLAGEGSDIVQCRQCMNCFASLGKQMPVSCKVNKEMGKQ
ncbi:MAG: NADH:flavin oxidoreductase [Desulfobacteraceae bacterium]|nr:MAG: NADH:flavin oxidoreductase [Desulfobacteraceae bacterium]